MKKSKTIAKIMISGYYGFNNTGDEAILTSMVRAFKEKDGRFRLIGSRCPKCGELWYPRRFICPKCHSTELEPYQCAQEGEVITSWVDFIGFPVIGFEDIDDRVVAMIKLDDGIHIMAEIVDIRKEVPKGTRVKSVIRQLKRDDTGNLMYGSKFEIINI